MLINEFLIIIIRLIRPLLGGPGACKYELTCTEFAIYQLKEKNFIVAIWESTKRVLSCNPLTNLLQKLGSISKRIFVHSSNSRNKLL